MTNLVFIATSLDGYIADKDGNIDWLHSVPNPENNDMGFFAMFDRIDALVMGRNTFEIVANMDVEWPYTKPVFVLSHTLESLPEEYEGLAFLAKGPVSEVIDAINLQGYKNLYIDGGVTIQHCLKEDLIDEMIITTMPVLLGGGAPLFGVLDQPLDFTLKSSQIFLDTVVQNHYIRVTS